MLADILTKAAKIVAEEYPESLLIEARGLPEAGSQIRKVSDIRLWQLKFMYKHVHTVRMPWIDGNFAEPLFDENITIRYFPIVEFITVDLAAGLSQALKVSQQEFFLGVTLSHPVVPEITEPRLLFVKHGADGKRSVSITTSGHTSMRYDP